MKKTLPACTLACLFIALVGKGQQLPTVADKTKEFSKYKGFLNFYWDNANGKIWWEVDKLNQEFLYVNSLPAGLGSNDIGLDRGQLGSERIVSFRRVGKKLLLIQPNYTYRAVSKNPNEQRAVEESFAQSVLWGFTVAAEENGKVLVDATDFLLRDAHKVADRLTLLKQGSFKLEPSRSAIYLPNTKNFPKNSEFEAIITFTSTGAVGNFVSSVAPSSEAITLRMHHSFVELPDDHFKPRSFDPRSSFIPTAYYDYATPVDEPIVKYVINHHRLQKKDPAAAVSEPVKPIVYYLDNGIPEPIRSALLEGASWWNQAFEAAGYKNAFQVKILPDSADPMDIRYNMINWVHRSTRGWSYGASVVDPRTGEIIKGNVSLGSLRVRQDYLIATGLLAPFENGKPADDKMLKMALSRLKQLAAHEVGHTLGLMHNYAASVSNRASVMDYPPPVVKLNADGRIDLADAYATGIGEWDKVSIAYGYSDFAPGTDEKKALNEILSKAEKAGLQFISDRDARPPGGLHPFAHLWDNGKDPVQELVKVLAIRQKALDHFSEKNILPGTPMALLEDVLVPMYNYHRYQLEAVTKLIGGMNYTYALRGDGQLVTAPLPQAQQQQALDAVLECLSPKILTLPENILRLIPPRPAGYEPTRELFDKRTGLAFDPMAAAEAAANLPLSLLFHPERANRLVEYKARHKSLGFDDLLHQLIKKTWKAPRLQGLEKQVQLQTEQLVLTHLMALCNSDLASYQVKAFCNSALKELKSFIEKQLAGTTDSGYQAHLSYALERMKSPDKIKPSPLKEMPPGAPIGEGAMEE